MNFEKYNSRKLIVLIINYVFATGMLYLNIIDGTTWAVITTASSTVYMGTNTAAKFATKTE